MLQQAVGTTSGSSRARVDFGSAEQLGVDAGDDARVFGRFLVILRRGRLYSFDLGPGGPREQTLRLLGFVNLYGASSDGSVFRRWYKLMVRGDRIIVVGYDVSARDVEIQLLRIDGDGVVSRTAMSQLRVNCAYGRCDARLAGDKLVLFASAPLKGRSADPLSALRREVLPDSKGEDVLSSSARRAALFVLFPNDSLVGAQLFSEFDHDMRCDVASIFVRGARDHRSAQRWLPCLAYRGICLDT